MDDVLFKSYITRLLNVINSKRNVLSVSWTMNQGDMCSCE